MTPPFQWATFRYVMTSLCSGMILPSSTAYFVDGVALGDSQHMCNPSLVDAYRCLKPEDLLHFVQKHFAASYYRS